jgi:enhancing lycopene biosynthesis protein 2
MIQLCNCRYDGTEIHEAAACLAALTRSGADPIIYAPDAEQAHVVDHQTGQEMEQTRNVLSESARIARGAVKPLSELNSAQADAVVFPGGFGAAKNLSDFGFKGAEMTVKADVERVLKDFNSAGKPIALCCIAPLLAAKVFGTSGVKVHTSSPTHAYDQRKCRLIICFLDNSWQSW